MIARKPAILVCFGPYPVTKRPQLRGRNKCIHRRKIMKIDGWLAVKGPFGFKRIITAGIPAPRVSKIDLVESKTGFG